MKKRNEAWDVWSVSISSSSMQSPPPFVVVIIVVVNYLKDEDNIDRPNLLRQRAIEWMKEWMNGKKTNERIILCSNSNSSSKRKSWFNISVLCHSLLPSIIIECFILYYLIWAWASGMTCWYAYINKVKNCLINDHIECPSKPLPNYNLLITQFSHYVLRCG